MPMTVITVVNAPKSLRGDLTKWMQEIATGVYVGNFNSRIREQLWQRVTESVANGEATMSYTYRNEIGYQFETYKTYRQNISYDGIPLVLIPSAENENSQHLSKGFSNASKFHKIRKFSTHGNEAIIKQRKYVVIDIETDGLDEKKNHIIEIGAIKVEGDQYSSFQKMIEYSGILPKEITELTGISEIMLNSDGRPIEEVLKEFKIFIGELPIIGYSINFDIKFINQKLLELNIPILTNQNYDLFRFVKKDKMFLKNYHLETVLGAYKMNNKVEHRALSDAELINELSMKVNGFLDLLDKQ